MLAGKIGYFRASFNPRNVGTLNGWWDASDNSTITTVSGVVSQWNDKSTNARHLSQGTAANRPGLGTLNGVQCLTFNGTTSHLLRTPGVSGLSGTYFIAWKTNQVASQNYVAFAVGTSSPSQAQFGIGHNSSTRWAASSRAASIIAIEGSLTSATNAVVLSAEVSSTTITSFMVNGSSFTTTGGTGVQGNSSAITAGCNYSNSVAANFANGSIGEILWYSGSLSAASITSVRNYLAAKWGITL